MKNTSAGRALLSAVFVIEVEVVVPAAGVVVMAVVPSNE